MTGRRAGTAVTGQLASPQIRATVRQWGGERTRPRRGLLLLLPAVACIVGACSGGPLVPSAKALPATGARLLASASPADQAKLSNAVERLTQECMSGKGLTYFPTYVPSPSSGTGNPLPEFPAYSGMASRRANGYGMYAIAVKAAAAKRSPGRHQVIPSQSAYENAMSSSKLQAYEDALYGPPGQTVVIDLPGGAISTARSGGCRAEAVTRLYGSVQSYIYAFEGEPLIYDYFINQVEAAPPFKTAVHRWSACMQRSGFTFPTPNAAFDDLAQQYDKRGPTRSLRRREVSIATADQSCAMRVSLIKTTTDLQGKAMANLSAVLRRQVQTIDRTDQLALSELPLVSSAAGLWVSLSSRNTGTRAVSTPDRRRACIVPA
jgi:hypothetical protein